MSTMSNIYILQSQSDLYLSKSGDWVSGDDSKVLFRTQHKDEAINQKVELTVKQPELRVNVGIAQLGDKGKLILRQEPKVLQPKNTPTEAVKATDEHNKKPLEGEIIHSTNIEPPTQQLKEQATTPNKITGYDI